MLGYGSRKYQPRRVLRIELQMIPSPRTVDKRSIILSMAFYKVLTLCLPTAQHAHFAKRNAVASPQDHEYRTFNLSSEDFIRSPDFQIFLFANICPREMLHKSLDQLVRLYNIRTRQNIFYGIFDSSFNSEIYII